MIKLCNFFTCKSYQNNSQNSVNGKNQIVRVTLELQKVNASLFEAIKCGDLETITTFIESGGNVNRSNENNITLFCSAAKYYQLAILKYLVSQGADIFVSDSSGMSALHLAVANGNMECIKYLIEIGLDVNITDNNNNTPLHIAGGKGNLAVLKYLVDMGADVSIRNFSEITFADFIAVNNHKECLLWAITYSAVPLNYITAQFFTNTPIYDAATNGDLNALRNMYANGAYVGRPEFFIIAAKNGHLNCIQFLIEEAGYFVDISKTDSGTSKYFCNPILEAAEAGQLNVIKYLVECGADIFVENQTYFHGDELNALHYAVKSGNEECIRYLIEKGLDVNAVGFYQRAPVHFAAKQGLINILELLKSMGANMFVMDSTGMTPLHKAAFNGDLKCFKYLLDIGFNLNYGNGQISRTANFIVSPLQVAAKVGNLEIIKHLVDCGVDVTIEDDYGRNALFYAIASEKSECIKYMIDIGIDVMGTFDEGYTPVHLAAAIGYTDILKTLHENGGDIFVKALDFVETTPIHMACRYGNNECIKYLVDCGADITLTYDDPIIIPIDRFSAMIENMFSNWDKH